MDCSGPFGASMTRRLRDRIAAGGLITFSDFMDAALYDPELGYYTRSTGAPDDYFTSVSAHPVFGAMLANHLDDLWYAFERPDPFHVIELGAGDGCLAGHILAAAAEYSWGPTLHYTGVEVSPARRSLSSAGLLMVASIEAVGPFAAAAVLSNEYFDALPFHLLRRSGDSWIEERVDIADDGFTYVDATPGPAALAYAEQYGVTLPDGGRLEARPAIGSLYSKLSALATKISITTIDYGGLAETVHSERMKAGTALAYREHQAGEDLLADPGQQDLTAHVNFTTLIDAGRASGLEALPLVQQVDFLAALGIGEYLPHLQSVPGVTPERYERERNAILQLLDPVEMGRFRVLCQLPSGVGASTLNSRPLRGFQPSL